MGNTIHTLALCLPGFLLAVVCHEAAHAYVATRFGDDTPRRAGRLSLNPMVHADLVGTIIFPLIGIVMGGIPFGWAKPVPINPARFKNVKHGIFWVSFAGPGANLLLAFLSALFFAIIATKVDPNFYLYRPLTGMFRYSVLINIVLAVFNLIPFPPLDGSKMVSTFLDYNQARKYEELQRFSFVFIILLWTTPIFSYLLSPAMLIGNLMLSGLIRLFS